jgi:uncharacterized protein YyaL (SSP411 family)
MAVDPKELSSVWLLRSGILNRNYWALHYGYNLLRKKYTPLYTEATGYGVKWLLNCANYSGNAALLDYAKKLGHFIHSSKISLNSERAALRSGYRHAAGCWDSYAYSFDTAICISSLIDLGKSTKSKEFLEDALQCGYWLVQEAQNSDGSFKACIDVNSRRFLKLTNWFGDRSCLHAKIAMSLYSLYECTRDQLFIDAFESLLDWLLSVQQPSGGVFAREGVSYVFTHSHCYALEALAFAYEKTKEEKYLAALKKGIDWLAKRQDKDGGFFDFYGLARPIPWKRIDATAQACRLFIGMHLLESEGTYILAARRAADFLARNQVTRSGDENAIGGFYTKSLGLVRWSELNSWTALFANHAFHLLESADKYSFSRFVTELF